MKTLNFNKNGINLPTISTITTLLFPLFASAQTIQSIFAVIDTILRAIIPVLMVLATVIFLWGLIMYLTAGGDEEKMRTGRLYMLWGIIVLFVMVVVWGLVLVLSNTFGIQQSPIPPGPQ